MRSFGFQWAAPNSLQNKGEARLRSVLRQPSARSKRILRGNTWNLYQRGNQRGSHLASPFFARSHQVNAARGNFLVLPGETRGPLPRKRRGKEKRGEEGEICMDAISSRSHSQSTNTTINRIGIHNKKRPKHTHYLSPHSPSRWQGKTSHPSIRGYCAEAPGSIL